MPLDLDRARGALEGADPVAARGAVRGLIGLAIRATVPGARVGDVVRVERSIGDPLLAEVVGFDDEDVRLLPFGGLHGIGPGDEVVASGKPASVRAGAALLGRVLDGLGDPIDGQGPVDAEPWPILRDAPAPLSRARITAPMVTGVRAIDGLATLGVGQRVGLFSGSGVGKSTLLGRVAQSAEADVIVVALVGERGREVRAFLEDSLGQEGLARSVVVAATSDAPAVVRMRSLYVATAIAEHFREAGKRALLLVDSLTRFARAAREVGLAAGEPPGRRGYPPSVFAALPRLLERAGAASRGSITGVYSVLVEGGDMDEPVADEARGLLDGHLVLSRELAARGRWPAIDPLASLSRVMDRVTTEAHRAAATALRRNVAAYEAKRDLIALGAYRRGSDPTLDAALQRAPAIEAFLAQPGDEASAMDETLAALERVVR